MHEIKYPGITEPFGIYPHTGLPFYGQWIPEGHPDDLTTAETRIGNDLGMHVIAVEDGHHHFLIHQIENNVLGGVVAELFIYTNFG